jgi:hypothetical protein
VLFRSDTERRIQVRVKRFVCKSCKRLCYADEPFYPDTRMGSPVIDLCKTFAATLPFCRTSTYLSQMGIAIDRGSVRNYANRDFPEIPMLDIFNIQLPISIISLSTLATSAGDGSGIEREEVLAACGFPSAYRTALRHPLRGKEGEVRLEEEEERETGRPRTQQWSAASR